MKIRIALLASLLLITLGAFAQNSKKVKEVTIKSSIQCGMCENRLNEMFAEFWAVKEVNYDFEEQTITVKYNPKKTDVEEIRAKIAETGYDADDVAAIEEAYKKLPGCCQKGGHVPM